MKCNAFFKKESDYYEHASNCSGMVQINICDKCEREVVSKAALKKHRKGCHGNNRKEACRNGEQCRFYKAKRCSFFHPPQHQQQQTRNHMQQLIRHQPPQQKQQQPRAIQQPNQVEPQQMRQETHQQQDMGWHTVQTRRRKSLEEQRKDQRRNIVCRWGEGCKRLKSGLCPLKHSKPQNSIPQQSQSPGSQLWCRYQERCFKGQDCTFRHFQQGFLQGNPQLSNQ